MTDESLDDESEYRASETKSPREIFTPGEYPQNNFVEREEVDREGVEWALKSGAPINIVGPPDSGKTSLAEQIVADIPSLTISGHNLDSEDDVARRLFADLIRDDNDIPPNQTPTEQRIEEVRGEPRDELRVVKDAFRLGELAILYDDFTDIPDGVKVYVANLIKAQYERGVTVLVTSSLSGRGDLTLANGDLSGRVRSVEVPSWEPSDLEKIARNGFARLDVDIDEDAVAIVADRAGGSPTEMHRLCLETASDR